MLALTRLNEIVVNDYGFSKDRVIINIGQSIVFLWNNTNRPNKDDDTTERLDETVNTNITSKTAQSNKDNNLDSERGDQELVPYSIAQVIDDDVEGKYRPVIGGYDSGKSLLNGKYVITPKIQGVFKFKIRNHPKDPPPCIITVIEEQPVMVQLNDSGFTPRFIKIDEGRSVKWEWNYCKMPHTIYQAEYCDKHNGLYIKGKGLVLPACSNSYQQIFNETGIYYFQTESEQINQKHICVVEVVESHREHLIEVTDSKFVPMVITIEEGDRVWFGWSKQKCSQKHCIYEILLPGVEQKLEEAYTAKPDGFKWTQPTHTGLLSHQFNICGIYYYSDITEKECASYIGVIIVKPKQSNFIISLDPNQIEPEISAIESGDRVWFKWNREYSALITFIDSNLLYDKKFEATACKAVGGCDEIPSNALARFGYHSVRIRKPGIYYYRIEINDNVKVATIIAAPAEKDHKIEITDKEFKPNVLNVNPEDRVWFIWTDTKRSHNIRQVTHRNEEITDGFASGARIESPGAYMRTFNEPGVYYFHSDGLRDILGAIVVMPEPTLHAINVRPDGITPDPLVANVNDTVAWIFPNEQTHDIVQIENQNDLLMYPSKAVEIIPRRCLSRSFKDSNVYHFASPSFNKTLKKDEMDDKGYKNIVLSSVIVDKLHEYILVIVDSDGFHPNFLNIQKGKSVLFDWKESNQMHNIVRIKAPKNEDVLEIIDGAEAFNSGELALNNNFLYTFEYKGNFCVASEGAPGFYCAIHVLEEAIKAETPKLVNKEPAIVSKYHKVFLHSETPDAKIFYTLNGVQPNKQTPSLRMYDAQNGILLSEAGFSFIRAVAMSDETTISDIFTSPRFFVINAVTNREDTYEEPTDLQDSSVSNVDWWRTIPRITVRSLNVNCAEVFWEKPPPNSHALISHYQLFINQASYKPRISADTNRILLKGLSAGRLYEISVMVYPKLKTLLPQQSNITTLTCPIMATTGGPVISLRANPKNDQITLYWLPVDSESCQVEYYQLIINDERKEMKIKTANHYNKVVIDGFEENTKYSVCVVALPKGDKVPLVSNEVLFQLPLDLSQISLPDQSLRKFDKDFYEEYIEIIEDSYDSVLNIRQDVPKVESLLLGEPIQEQFDFKVDSLPVPKVSGSTNKPGTILVEWLLTKLPPSPLQLTHFIVSLVGTEFGMLNKSDSSYDCFMELGGVKLPAVQHCWNVNTKLDFENKFLIEGIIDTSIYQISVTAVFSVKSHQRVTEYKKSSETINFISLGPPNAPRLRVIGIDIQSIALEWVVADYPKPEYITGYRLMVNSELKEKFNPDQHGFIFNDLTPGKTYKLELTALTNSIIGQSEPSRPMTIICPAIPKPPSIFQSSTLKANSAVVSWKPSQPQTYNREDQILTYKVYINDQYHGEIFSSNLSTYSYLISDLEPGQAYDVSVRAICGGRMHLPSEDDVIYSLITSDSSNTIVVTPTAPPLSPALQIESVSPEGIEVTWTTPQQYGEAALSGFQLVRNGVGLDNVLPPDATRATIDNIKPGEMLNLQIKALTNHPCGQFSTNQDHPNFNLEFTLVCSDNADENLVSVNKLSNKYSACKPGQSLIIKYTGILIAPSDIIVEKIAGHSAIVTWKIRNDQTVHHLPPEYFSVSYWPTDNQEENVQILSTKNHFIELNNLKPSTKYTVAIESRKDARRLVELSDENNRHEYAYLYYSKALPIDFETASPPQAPTNLSLVTSTCHELKIRWDLPVDNGVDLVATRVNCYPLNMDHTKHIIKECIPDVNTCIIDNLMEKTKYRIIVTSITEEYFREHNIKELKQLPKHKLESGPWLPSAYIDVCTSGTDTATSIQCEFTHDSKINVYWKAAKVYGTNNLINQTLCYNEISSNDRMSSQIVLPASATNCIVNDMKIGSKYKIWIEAVVSIKTNLDVDSGHRKYSYFNEIKERRTINVLSEPIVYRVPAPCETPVLLLAGYTDRTIDLYWPKPLLYTEHPCKDDPDKKYRLNRRLLGYRIEVNDINQKELSNKENVVTLTKCKPANSYNIVLIARTCLLNETNNLDEIDLSEIDETRSKVLHVRLPSDNEFNKIRTINAIYEDVKEESSIGRIRLDWDIHDTSGITQYNVNWFSSQESMSQKKTIDSSNNFCIVPVMKPKCIYEVYLEVVYKNMKSHNSERLFIEIPGSPDAPHLWLKSNEDNTYVVNWSEPRLYPHVPCIGYQLYVNSAKYGAKVAADLHETSVTLKPNRSYKIAIQALTDRVEYTDSVLSNTVDIITQMPKQLVSANNAYEKLAANNQFRSETKYNQLVDKTLITIRDFYSDKNQKEVNDCNLPIKILKVSEDHIQLDWSYYVIQQKIEQFRIQWHCWNTDKHDEDYINGSVLTYTIKNLSPGQMYAVRVNALHDRTRVVNKSKYLIIQTNAPPDPPILRLRASNFKYITVEWTKPTCYGEAAIVAYKVEVDDKVQACLSSEQTAFTLSNGDPCHEYKFQIRALTNNESLSSALSSPLYVLWPGIKSPNLQILENNNSVVKIGWDEPKITGNAKVSYYRVISECEQTSQTLIQGPFEPTKRNVDLCGMDPGTHKIVLEINAYGAAEPFFSAPVFIDFGYKPEAPYLVISIPAVEEREKLDRIACNLLNKRDRLLKTITNSPIAKRPREVTKGQIAKSMVLLSQLDEALDDCLNFVNLFTGYFVTSLTWKCEQSNPSVKIIGYRVYINGKQYGTDLPESIRSIRIKLSLEKVVYQVHVTAFAAKPFIESQESNTVEILTESFLPFTYYCYHNIHTKCTVWPKQGCCAFQDSIHYERLLLARTREIINIGSYAIPQPIQQCQVFDLRSSKAVNIIEKNRTPKFTILLFWAKWCIASMRLLNYFVTYSRRNTSQYDFTACHHGTEGAEELKELFKKTGYLESTVRFCSDSTELLKVHDVPEFSLTDLYDIKGLPTIMIINKDGQLVWKGRHCNYDYSQFENFMHHTLCEVIEAKCPIINCDICANDNNIDSELHALRSEQKYMNQYKDTITRPSATNATDSSLVLFTPVDSQSKIKYNKQKPKNLISVSQRPYSANLVNSTERNQLFGSKTSLESASNYAILNENSAFRLKKNV